MNKMNNLFIPFTKSDDELRMVYGYASTGALIVKVKLLQEKQL